MHAYVQRLYLSLFISRVLLDDYAFHIHPPIVLLAFHYCSAPRRHKKVEVKLLDGITGYVRPGEMLLVLGPPGSGCSTLLAALAGRLSSNLRMEVRGRTTRIHTYVGCVHFAFLSFFPFPSLLFSLSYIGMKTYRFTFTDIANYPRAM